MVSLYTYNGGEWLYANCRSFYGNRQKDIALLNLLKSLDNINFSLWILMKVVSSYLSLLDL